jgi:hypothetical protein
MVVVGAMSSVASNATSFQTLDKTQNRNIKNSDHWTKTVKHTDYFFPISKRRCIGFQFYEIYIYIYGFFFQSVASVDQMPV